MSPIISDRQPKKPGQIKEITSLANPIIKDIKTLSQKKKRDETGTFMAEGLKLVIDALELGWTIHILVYALEAKGARRAGAGSERQSHGIRNPARQSADGRRHIRDPLARP
jgi:tRNA G18 (ribose-2'-O)-methylase SpoU